MSYKHHWANPSTTSGWQNYPGGWVYTGGIGMPTARLNFYGNRPIRVHSFGDYYISSGFMRMNYGGSILDAGGIALFGGSGGSFQWEAHSDSQMFFGRDLGAGGTVTSFNDGFVWSGTLAGSFWWDQVPNPPGFSSITPGSRRATVVVGLPDDGGTAISAYSCRYRRNGGAWSAQVDQASRTFEFTGLTPGTYDFQAWAHNAVGASQISTSGTYTVNGNGKRYDGTSWIDVSTGRRYDGSSFVALTTQKRFNGSSWVDLGG